MNRISVLLTIAVILSGSMTRGEALHGSINKTAKHSHKGGHKPVKQSGKYTISYTIINSDGTKRHMTVRDSRTGINNDMERLDRLYYHE